MEPRIVTCAVPDCTAQTDVHVTMPATWRGVVTAKGARFVCPEHASLADAYVAAWEVWTARWTVAQRQWLADNPPPPAPWKE